MKDLKDLILSIRKSLPGVSWQDSVMSDALKAKQDLSELKERMQFLKKLDKCQRADDLIAEFSLDAAKAYVTEMKYGISAKDRLKASEKLLDHSLGKPVDRVLSISMEVGAKTDEELESEIKKLISELGYEGKERETSSEVVAGKASEGY